MLKFRIIFIACIWAMYHASAQPFATRADQLLQAYADQHKFSGTVLIAVGDSIVFHKAYAFADIQKKQPNTTHTTFRAGSLTKMFTAALILQLAAEEKLSLEDDISKYITNAEWSKGINIRHLLSHTAGLSGSTPAGAVDLSELVTGFQTQAAATAPGQRFAYNNFNFLILSYIAEKITGQSYPSLVAQRVLNKAGMHRSGIDLARRTDADKATGYTMNPITGEWVATGLGEGIRAASCAGALYTTTEDLYRWVTAIHDSAIWLGNSYQQATTPVTETYGLGWMVRRRNGHLQIGHTGSIEGFQSMMLLFPEDSVTVIYLSNLQDMNTESFEKNLIALALGEPYQLPVVVQELQLSATGMKEFTGIYGKDKSNQMNVQIEAGKLMITAPGGDKLPLTAVSKDHFVLKGPDIEVTFNRSGAVIISLYVKMGGGMLFEKVNP